MLKGFTRRFFGGGASGASSAIDKHDAAERRSQQLADLAADERQRLAYEAYLADAEREHTGGDGTPERMVAIAPGIDLSERYLEREQIEIREYEADLDSLDTDSWMVDGDEGEDGGAGGSSPLRLIAQASAGSETTVEENGVERRAFVMHENLLRDVIQRQAGSLAKAVLEGVMNLIEAGASKGAVTITADRVVIVDDGRGFSSREEILEAFEVFGKSDARRAIAGRWAEFQMGRGQLMAFGRTSYRTHTFEMTTDINAASTVGIGYTLHSDLPDVPGCTVTVDLYERLGDWEIVDTVAAVQQVIKYVDVPIEVNGTVVTVDPATEKWSFEDENAWYRVRGNQEALEIFNLGVFVCKQHGWGTGGTIVSKKRLKLNFARNDIIRTCPVWKAVSAEFKARTRDALLEKKAPSATDVSLILDEMDRGRFPIERVQRVPMLRDTNGRRLSPEQLIRGLAKLSYDPRYVYDAFTFDHAQSLKADYAMKSRRWLVLDEDFSREAFEMYEYPRDFGDLGRLSNLLLAIAELKTSHWGSGAPKPANVAAAFVQREDLYNELSFEHQIIQDDVLTREESAVLTALRRENRHIARACDVEPRFLLVGMSDRAEAWTDGERIVIERSFLRNCLKTAHGMLRMLTVLVHEYTHDDDRLTHDEDFNQKFHDAMMHVAHVHTRVLSAVSRVSYGRLKTFQKTASLAALGMRRLARDRKMRESTAFIPCPGCAVLEPKPHRYPEAIGLNVFEGGLTSAAAFAEFLGDRLTKPPSGTGYDGIERAQCPICETAYHPKSAFAAVTTDLLYRVCVLAVESAIGGVLPLKVAAAAAYPAEAVESSAEAEHA